MTLGGIRIDVRMNEIAKQVPKLAAESIAKVLAEGLRYLQEDTVRDPSNTRQPYDTGNMREETTIEVVNQYVGHLTSPVYYTTPQEYGFFNVWAKRWLPGRFFMKDAEQHMDELKAQIIDDYFSQNLE